MENYFWCIGGGILQVPLIQELRKLDLKAIVTDGDAECICHQLADTFNKIDIHDAHGHIEWAKKLRKKLNIVGVLAAGIDAPVTMSKVAEFLKLPGVPSHISEIVHYKSNFRDFCASNDIETPGYKAFRIGEWDLFREHCDKIQTPFIIKNVDSSASRGTKIFYHRDPIEEIKIATQAANFSKSKLFLVESLWIGKECTVETIFDINGNFHECFITDRLFNYESGYPIETGLVSPSQLSEDKQKNCFKLAKSVSKKLGIKIGAAKFDIIYTEKGPKIIEMTTRLSGGFDCQYLVPASLGLNVLGAAIVTACGKEIPKDYLEPKFNKVSVSASNWPKPGTIKRISGISEAKKIKGVEQIFFRKEVGDTVEEYNNCVQRTNFIIASGSSLSEAQRAVQNAIDRITIETI